MGIKETTMQTGTIAGLNDKGFGFIKVEGQEKDLFFHANDVEGEFNDLRQGDTVEFEMGSSDKGPKAENVRKA